VKSYSEFLARKRFLAPAVGLADPPELSPHLFPFQAAVTRWALRRGKASLWLDTGLGKSRCAIEWGRVVSAHAGGMVLILTPLAVAQQFAREGAAIDVPVTVCREPGDLRPGINVTNYERSERFPFGEFAGVVLDESSRIKDFTSSTRNQVIEAFARTPFKLACSATPAPNDHTELGNHAEFMGAMTRSEMLSMFFVHDGETTQEWRLKGHAKADFWRWVASWAMAIRRPSDIGFSDDGYILPPLNVHDIVTAADPEQSRQAGLLFGYQASTLTEQRQARRDSLSVRVAACAEIVAREPGEQWLIWCDLNAESEALAAAIPGAVEIRGSDDPDEKERRVLAFADGQIRVLVTKPSICGAGLNLQRCARTAFVGLSHSWEQWYQGVRRIYRFGQRRPVDCYLITSPAEGAVAASLKRKQAAADEMAVSMVAHMREAMLSELAQLPKDKPRTAAKKRMVLPPWL
jgi:hypothetical protein